MLANDHCESCGGFLGTLCLIHTACVRCSCKKLPLGWVCPVCQRGVSPHTQTCSHGGDIAAFPANMTDLEK